MDGKDKETCDAENVEMRITELKSQLQKSYDIFHRAHLQLGQFSFDSSTFASTSSSSAAGEDVPQIKTEDIKEILNAGSVEDSISIFRSKVGSSSQKIDFPNFSSFVRIMNDLQSNLDGLQKSQDSLAKLTEDVNEEMNMLQKRLEESVEEINELIVENLDDDDGFSSHEGDNEDDGDEEEDESSPGEEDLGTDSFSDWKFMIFSKLLTETLIK